MFLSDAFPRLITKTRRTRKINMLFVFFAALIVRLVFMFQFRNDLFFDSPLFDAEFYSVWAKSISEGDWLGRNVFFVSPLYAYFLAALYKMFDYSLHWVIFSQLLLGAANCALIYLIGKKIFGETVGLISGLIAALYGFFLFTESQLLKNSLAYFLTALSFFLFLLGRENGKPILWVCLGTSAGLSALVIPNILVFIPVLFCFLIFAKEEVKKRLVKAGALCIGIFITIGPVFIRNYAVGGDPVPISSNGGINLFLGTDPATDGGILVSRVIEQAPELEEQSSAALAERALQKRLRPSEVSRFWYSVAVRNMTQDISASFQLLIRKLYRFWNWRELTDNLDFYYFRDKYPILGIPFMNFGAIASLSFLGLWFSRSEKERVLPALVFIIVFTAASLPFPIFGRYRTPFVPVLIVFAAYGLNTIFRMISEKKWKAIAPGMAILVICAALINSGDRTQNFSSMRRAAGEIYLKKGQPEKAIPELVDSVSGAPDDFYAHNSLGEAYLETGRYGEAIASFRNAVTLNPDFVDAHYSLGLAYAVTGNREGASGELEKVKMLDASGERSWMMERLISSMGGKRG